MVPILFSVATQSNKNEKKRAQDSCKHLRWRALHLAMFVGVLDTPLMTKVIH